MWEWLLLPHAYVLLPPHCKNEITTSWLPCFLNPVCMSNYSVSVHILPVAKCNYSVHVHCIWILQHNTNRMWNWGNEKVITFWQFQFYSALLQLCCNNYSTCYPATAWRCFSHCLVTSQCWIATLPLLCLGGRSPEGYGSWVCLSVSVTSHL